MIGQIFVCLGHVLQFLQGESQLLAGGRCFLFGCNQCLQCSIEAGLQVGFCLGQFLKLLQGDDQLLAGGALFPLDCRQSLQCCIEAGLQVFVGTFQQGILLYKGGDIGLRLIPCLLAALLQLLLCFHRLPGGQHPLLFFCFGLALCFLKLLLGHFGIEDCLPLGFDGGIFGDRQCAFGCTQLDGILALACSIALASDGKKKHDEKNGQ